VGPYRILRKIRQGGQGSVYLGYDNLLQRRVAIKIYPLPAGRAGRRSLLREARLVASIQNSRVVQIHDVITSRAHLALVMEYVPGTDLEQFLRVARPSISSVISVATDLAGALAAARQQHIVHGDLKASNVLIASSGRAKLTDFGIARAAGLGAGATGVAGSHAALSPEQYRGDRLDIRSDLFSLGSLMYRMLSGQHPFFRRGSLDPSLLLEEPPLPLDEAIPSMAELPAGLAELVNHLLQKDPRDRPANTHQVRQALRRVAREVPLSAGNPMRAEAAPCFRPETAEELPLPVPEELALRGRSRLQSKEERERWSWRNPRARPRLAVLAASLLSLALLAGYELYQFGWGQPTRVHIDAPQLAVSPAASLPEGVSVEWLVAEVKAMVSGHLGPILVTGPVGATPVRTLYTRGRSPAAVPPAERYGIGLRCSEEFCLLGLSRERNGQHFAGRAMLFPDRPLFEWRAAVSQAAEELFSRPGYDVQRVLSDPEPPPARARQPSAPD
jgi:serine/threonine protein kinase